MKTLHIIIKGKVQGVGFRAKVEHFAKKLGVNGSVRNLSDGSVEVYAQGAEEELDKFVDAIQSSSGLIKVDQFIKEECNIQKKYDSFAIVF